MAFNGLSLARQQFKPDWRVHGTITQGGVKPNIIPDLTEANFMVRAPTEKELAELKQRMVGVVEGAATSTGCEVTYWWTDAVTLLVEAPNAPIRPRANSYCNP